MDGAHARLHILACIKGPVGVNGEVVGRGGRVAKVRRDSEGKVGPKKGMVWSLWGVREGEAWENEVLK